MNKINSVSIILFMILSISNVSALTEIDSCITITEPGTYILNKSIFDVSSYWCMDIESDNVVLDGAGHTISVSKSKPLSGNTGIRIIRHSGITVTNISVDGFINGVGLAGGSNNTLLGSTINNNYYGIFLSTVSDTNISGNTIKNNIHYGMALEGGIYANLSIYNNYFSNDANVIYRSHIPSKITWNITLQEGKNIIGGDYIGGNFWANPSNTGYSQTCEINSYGMCNNSYVSLNLFTDYLPLALTYIPDYTIPASIIALKSSDYSSTHSNWSWINPIDSDFDKTIIYLNGVLITELSKEVTFYNVTGLTPNTEYTISIQTVDTSRNINQMFINSTIVTLPTRETSTMIIIGSYSINQESIIEIPIEITNSIDIAGGKVIISYNHSIVNVIDIVPSDFDIVYSKTDNSIGQVEISSAMSNSVKSKDAVFAILKVRSVGIGTSKLTIKADSYLNGIDGLIFYPTIHNGIISILKSEINGDVNGNGIRDTGDATIILRSIVELSTPIEFKDRLIIGNVNCNGILDTGDVTLILRDSIGLDIVKCWE